MMQEFFLCTGGGGAGAVEEMGGKLRVKGEIYVLDPKPGWKMMRKSMRRENKRQSDQKHYPVAMKNQAWLLY